MALSIELETNRKLNAHTSRLACCRSGGIASRLACCRSAGVASRLACCQWPLCAIPPVTPTDRQTARSTTALPGRRIASLCPRLRSSWRDNQLRVILRTFGKDPYGAPSRSYVEKHRCSDVIVGTPGHATPGVASSSGHLGSRHSWVLRMNDLVGLLRYSLDQSPSAPSPQHRIVGT